VSSRTVLVASEDFDAKLSRARATRAIARGLHAADPALAADPCPIDALPADFDTRMRAAHAVILAPARLTSETLLQGAGAFEAATRARQSGVPCYAITGENRLDLFQARILDLQVMLEARSEQGLRAAARKLAGLL
jgi:hypothetical protein